MEQLTAQDPYAIYIYKEEREYINNYEEDCGESSSSMVINLLLYCN